MSLKLIIAVYGLLFLQPAVQAQFAPPAGQPGSTAIHKDSTVFVSWASGCTVSRGYQDISNTSLGYASVGDSSMALGIAGSNGVVSLGDGGSATLTFDAFITNGPGWDFAVFENAFSDVFLELAFVEVSSDGINFSRFPCTSYTQDTLQVGGFGSTDATKIDNLAGKYRTFFGTPFDLQQLAAEPGLNVNMISHVRVVDVVGCIQPAYARYDQYGNIINEPWSTPFASGGFDLDAVGLINQSAVGITDQPAVPGFTMYPNPANGSVALIPGDADVTRFTLTTLSGQEVTNMQVTSGNRMQPVVLDLSAVQSGIYFVSVFSARGCSIQKLVITHD